MPLNGISVVLTGTKEKYYGMSIAWTTLVEKSHILISIPKNTDATNFLLLNKQFSVNILTNEQKEIAKQFGGEKSIKPNSINENIMKFSNNGLPIINNCCSNYMCSIYLTNEIEEQIVVIGSIIESINTNKKPLMFNKADYFE